MSKLDTFNKDKFKCKKCKKYFDEPSNSTGFLSDGLCEYCAEKWYILRVGGKLGGIEDRAFKDWCKDEQS